MSLAFQPLPFILYNSFVIIFHYFFSYVLAMPLDSVELSNYIFTCHSQRQFDASSCTKNA